MPVIFHVRRAIQPTIMVVVVYLKRVGCLCYRYFLKEPTEILITSVEFVAKWWLYSHPYSKLLTDTHLTR
jgi:hypothetical protein